MKTFALTSPPRRRLTTLAAQLRRRQGPVETSVVYEAGWMHALRRVVQEGDVVVCPSEEIPPGRRPRRTLADQVVAELGVPAYLLDGFPPDLDVHPRFRLGSITAWVALLVILAVFGWIQIQIVVQTHDWLQSLLLVTSVGLELASLLTVGSQVSAWR